MQEKLVSEAGIPKTYRHYAKVHLGGLIAVIVDTAQECIDCNHTPTKSAPSGRQTHNTHHGQLMKVSFAQYKRVWLLPDLRSRLFTRSLMDCTCFSVGR